MAAETPAPHRHVIHHHSTRRRRAAPPAGPYGIVHHYTATRRGGLSPHAGEPPRPTPAQFPRRVNDKRGPSRIRGDSGGGARTNRPGPERETGGVRTVGRDWPGEYMRPAMRSSCCATECCTSFAACSMRSMRSSRSPIAASDSYRPTSPRSCCSLHATTTPVTLSPRTHGSRAAT